MQTDVINEWTDEVPRDITRPRFYIGPRKNEAKSLAEGRPIYDDWEYVEIHTPGDKSNIPVKPVTDEHRRRWPQHYKQFKDGMSQMGSGQPLKEWAPMLPSQVEELAFFKIYTVEDLANVSDGNLANVGPVRALRQKAIDHIAAGKKGAPVLKLREENAALRNEMEVLRRQLIEQAADIARLAKK